MKKFAAALSALTLIGLIAFSAAGNWPQASAGLVLPPPGTDELDINAEFDIDLFNQGPEAVELSGHMAIERGAPKGGMIPIEIVQLSLTGTSSLLGPGTPVIVELNSNPLFPATGQIGPVETFPAESFFDIYFDIKIGEFQHYTGEANQFVSLIPGIPPFDSKWESGPKQIPIIDATNQKNIPGFLLGADIWVKPPEKAYTITVLKQDDDGKAGLPGWEMNLYAGSSCSGGILDSDVTDADGLAEFSGLEPGIYSVEEKMQSGWNNVTPLCQPTTVPSTSGALAGLDPCPIPNNPFPEPGCDEFNSAASVQLNITNPDLGEFECDLGGPTQIQRGPVVSKPPDSIDTEIVAMELTGTCDPGSFAVTATISPDQPSLGRIVEQSDGEPGVLEFKADSFFDVYFRIVTPLATLHNQDALHLECKIQDIPPYGCLYEPDVGTVTLYDEQKKEVGTMLHAAHIPLDPKQKLLIFVNSQKPGATPTPTETPVGNTPTSTVVPGGPTATPTNTAVPGGPTPTPTEGPVPNDGDVNCNGETNSIDGLIVLQHVAGLLDLATDPLGGGSDTCPGQAKRADTNESGDITSIDTLLILQFDAGLLQSLPV